MRLRGLLALLAFAVSALAQTDDEPIPRDPRNVSIRHEVELAMKKAEEFLGKQPSGHVPGTLLHDTLMEAQSHAWGRLDTAPTVETVAGTLLGGPERAKADAALRWLGEQFSQEAPVSLPTPKEEFLLAVALTGRHVRNLNAPDGAKIDWVRKMAERLINSQNSSGSWKGGEERVATSFALSALRLVYFEL